MPIRINLLAEAQAAEELRRKDPTKRAIIGGIGLVALVVIYIVWLQIEIGNQKSRLAQAQAEYKRIEPQYLQVLTNRALIAAAEKNLSALTNMAASRFLWAPVLSALSQAMTNVSTNVSVVRIQTEQNYIQASPAVPPQFDPQTKKMTKPGIPAKITENIRLIITAKDYGKDTDENYNKMIQAMAEMPYFRQNLSTNGIHLREMMPPAPDPADPSRSFVQFTLECQFQSRTR